MVTEAPAPSSAQSYIWKVDGIDLSVEFAKTVLAQLHAALEAGAASGPLEIGGILLGRTERDGAGFRTFVEAFESFALENRYFPNYTLSGRDTNRIEQRLAMLTRRGKRGGLVPVGFWRAHGRRGLYVDQRDFDLFGRLFRRPTALLLLIRRDEPGAARGAVFVWEENDMRRHSSHLEFPLEPVPVTALAQPQRTVSRPRFAMPELAWPAIRGLALPRISVPRISLPELAWPNVRIPYLQMRWRPVAMGLLLLTVPLAAYFMGRAFGLNQNRGAIIARANVASGARPVPQPVQDTSTSQPAPEQPTAPADNLAVAIPPAIPDEPPAQPSISASRDRTLAVAAARRARPLKIPPLAPTLRTGAPALPEPPRVTPRSSMESLPSIIAGMPSLPSVHAEGVTAYVKPAPSSGIRHAFRKIFTGSHDAEDFVPATPLEHPLPAVPREDIPDNATVEFVARIDRTGAVAHVKFAEGNHQLTSASARALSQWRFQPARQNGAPVDSDLLVRFEFRRRH